LCNLLFVSSVATANPTWVSIGPLGDPGADGTGYTAVGRVNALAFAPNSPYILYAGSSSGGVWLSPDRGGSWSPLGDHKGLPNLGVGALAVGTDGSIYLGVGDPFSGYNHAVETATGGGVYKSIDGGATWRRTGTN